MQATRGASDRPQRAIGVSRTFACVLNTRGFPQVFYTAPVIHPVRVHKYPWQASQCGMGSIPYRIVHKKKLGVHWGSSKKSLRAFELKNSGVPEVAVPGILWLQLRLASAPQ
jgi:hypothetical protein